MIYQNVDPAWGAVGTVVTAQWYAQRAVELGIPPPTVVVTRIGLCIAGAVVAQAA